MDTNNSDHIIAGEGKVYRRISDGFVFSNEIYLGYTYYLGGEKLIEPLRELPEHFEEISVPSQSQQVQSKVFSMCGTSCPVKRYTASPYLHIAQKAGFDICRLSFAHSPTQLILDFLRLLCVFARLSIIQSRGKINIPPLLLSLNIINQPGLFTA